MAFNDPPTPPIPLNRLHKPHMLGLRPPPHRLPHLTRLRHATVAFALVTRRKAHQFLRVARLLEVIFDLFIGNVRIEVELGLFALTCSFPIAFLAPLLLKLRAAH